MLTEKPARDVLRITLLGTGIPNPQINAFGTSTLVEAGDERVMIDCGRGTVIRMSQVGLGVGHVDTIILSHYHSDHFAGIFDMRDRFYPTEIWWTKWPAAGVWAAGRSGNC